MNPFSDSDDDDWLASDIIALEEATVVTAKPHASGDDIGHHVEVKAYAQAESETASVAIGSLGSTAIPEEGDTVIVGHRRDGRPIVVAATYNDEDTVPEYEPGERRVGHPASNSYVRLKTDGSVVVNGENGNEIVLEADGTITLNGGSTAPVTDVSTTTDADGHVTGVSVTRADDVFVPSK
jgi:hypothetical protein